MKNKPVFKKKFVDFLRWSEKYIETDMVYAFKGSFWILFGKVGVFLISFAKMIVFGRYASQETYGIYTFIISMAIIVGIFSLPGIKTSLVKAIAQKKEGTLNLAIKEKLKFALISSFLCLLLSGWYFLNQNNVLALGFLVIAFLIPFQSVFTIFHSFWIGRKNFEKGSKYEIISAFLVALVVIPIIILTDDPVLIILSLFASQAFFNGIILIKTLRQKENEETMPETISFGKSLTIISGITSFADQIDKVIIWNFLGATPLAIYSFAQTPIKKIQALIPITHLALPKIGEKNIKEIKQGIIKKFTKLFLIFVPLALFVILIAPYFYKLFFPLYVESVVYFQAFSVLIALSPFLLLNTALVAEMKTREIYVAKTITPLFKIILFLALIPFFKIWGIVFAILISEIIKGIITFYYFKKI